jgi:TolB-like protein
MMPRRSPASSLAGSGETSYSVHLREERFMKSKTLVLVLALACICTAFAIAAPKVAVLDAVLPNGMDLNVAIGVTEKISEELVGSGRFTVLDRTTVGQSLKEIEFQMSGMVSDEQIKKAGEQLNSRLGAAFVVVSRVSQVGDTFFVTAKMIDIKTGEITAQASAEQEGKLAITLKIAQAVGKKLAGGVKEPVEEIQTELAEEKQPVEKPVAAAKPAPAPKKLHNRFAVYYSQPFISGDLENAIDSAYTGIWYDSFGFSVQWLQFVWKGLYVSAFLTGMLEDVTDGIDTYSVFEPIYDFQAGVGWGFAIGKAIQITTGVHAGYAGYSAGSWWIDYGDSYDGYSLGAELGLDWVVVGALGLCLRADYSIAVIGTVAESYLGLQLGVGWMY